MRILAKKILVIYLTLSNDILSDYQRIVTLYFADFTAPNPMLRYALLLHFYISDNRNFYEV